LTSERFTEEQICKVKSKLWIVTNIQQVAGFESELAKVQKEVQAKEASKEAIYQKTDDQLRVFRNQASAMENKRKMTIKEVFHFTKDFLIKT
jgi:hypothetical protein